jgi:NAD(P)-dependent dehydrogenase (short-subunit alcohol dehydrogenase family)
MKTALIAGTKKKSIGRFVANYLHKNGWEIWLYSRTAQKIDKTGWHERACDISSEENIKKLLGEIKNLDLAMMLADGGDAHVQLEDLSENDVKQCIDAKLIGSVLLNKQIVLKFSRRNSPLKIVWCAGKTGKKPKNLILYAMVNAGLASYIDDLNSHYSQVLEAYYLPTGLISPSTRGDEFIKISGPEIGKMAQSPQVVVDTLKKIITNDLKPGMIDVSKGIL